MLSITREIAELLSIFNQSKDKFLMECKVEETVLRMLAVDTKLPQPSQLWEKIRKFHPNGRKGLYGEYDPSDSHAIMWGQSQ